MEEIIGRIVGYSPLFCGAHVARELAPRVYRCHAPPSTQENEFKVMAPEVEIQVIAASEVSSGVGLAVLVAFFALLHEGPPPE
jgi:hypothetical protein